MSKYQRKRAKISNEA